MTSNGQRKISSLIATRWKDHWPDVLLGTGVVIVGIVVIVNHYFVGPIIIVIGVVIMLFWEAGLWPPPE